MFALAKIEDTIRIQPQDLGKPHLEALRDEVDVKYANKVLINVGLCICLHDILEIGDPEVDDGCVCVNITFRLIVLRPCVGEVLEGKIRSSTAEGIHVTLGFFHDIFVPKHLLMDGSVFDVQEQVWKWPTEGDDVDDDDEQADGEQFLYFDQGEIVRFRVNALNFKESKLTRQAVKSQLLQPFQAQQQQQQQQQQLLQQQQLAKNAAGSTQIDLGSAADRKDTSHFDITAAMNESGLGCVSWWKQ
ncbi:hypothetical protein MIR68_009638 [Amoeboaphelidium protococcarum]|nr:hypothetical protein MIR68_009638 [Amoeboaphelidium protococcarum]